MLSYKEQQINWTKNLAELNPTSLEQGWLEEKGSITQRLRLTYPDLTVKILQEGYLPPSLHEAQELISLEEVWLREVLIMQDDKALIYARTLIPNLNKTNAWAQLEKLGTKPLGEILFNRDDLKRSEFSFSNTWQLPPYPTGAHRDLENKFARRCSFYQNNQQLMLTEVFLEFV